MSEKSMKSVDKVRKVLQRMEAWGNESIAELYPAVARYFVENTEEWTSIIKEELRKKYQFYLNRLDDLDKVAEYIRNKLGREFDCEIVYQKDYSPYTGDGLYLCSSTLGEQVELVEVNAHPVLKALHDNNKLDDVLDELDGEFCIIRSPRRIRDENGRYKGRGRRTYMPYEHSASHPCFEIALNPEGQWHCIVPKKRLDELVRGVLDA